MNDTDTTPSSSPAVRPSGRTAYIPGGYGGIGEAIAWGLALRGARVAVSGRSLRQGGGARGAAARGRHDAHGVAMDAHSVSEIRRSVDEVAAAFGGLDILVNCVGIQREQSPADVTEEAFDEVVQVNLKAGDVPRAGGGETPDRGSGGAPAAGAPAVGARAARHARPRLLGLLRHQGRDW